MCHIVTFWRLRYHQLFLVLAVANLAYTLALNFNPLNLESWGLGTSSFVSDNGMLCAEGPSRTVEAALAMRKASVRGSWYHNSFAKSGMTCKSRQFRSSDVLDECYPGLTLFFKSDEPLRNKNSSIDIEQGAVFEYKDWYKLTDGTVDLMDACTCHPGSIKALSTRGKCTNLQMPGSWVHRNPKDHDDELTCHEAPFISAFRSLAVLKGTKLLPMHLKDQVSPQPCMTRGFTVESNAPDGCFENHRLWTSAEYNSDTGVKKDVESEIGLEYMGDFENMTHGYGLDHTIFDSAFGCQCSPRSKARESMNALCSQPGASPPIRDWWHE